MVTLMDNHSDNKSTSRLFHQVAQRLVELAQPKPGDIVLDVATGTGAVTLCVAPQVGSAGKVIGLDRAAGMLAQARQNIALTGWTNVELREGDLAGLSFADNTFDLVLCSSGLGLLTDRLASLRAWRRLLKPGGTVAFSGYGDQALQPLARLFETCHCRYGLTLTVPAHLFPWQRLGDLETCSDLLRNANYSAIDVRGEQLGYYLANSDEWWDMLWNSNLRGPLAQLAPDVLLRFKAEHLAAVADLATTQGIWLNVAAIFALGQKG